MSKKSKLEIINSIKIANPCINENFKTNSVKSEAGWYCGECKKDVYDLSKYTENEIIKLIEETNGNFCALIKKDSEGRIIYKQNPSYSKALLASSAIAASALLVSADALAQTNDTKNSSHQESSQSSEIQTLGEVSIEDPSSSSSSSSKSEESSCQETKQDKEAELGLIAAPSHTRGKIKIDKKP